MSRYILRLPATVSGLILVCCAYALCADEPRLENARVDEFSGEVIVIESKAGSSVAVEHPRTRTIAGQSFVGGVVSVDDSLPDSGELVGSRIWIPVGEISRIMEFDTKVQFAGRQTIAMLLKREGDLTKQLRVLSPGAPGHRYDRLNRELQMVKSMIAANANAPKKEQSSD